MNFILSRLLHPPGMFLGIQIFLLASVVGLPPLGAEVATVSTQSFDRLIAGALDRAQQNRSAIDRALEEAPASQSKAVRFLIAYMPDRDLQSLSADYILENVALAYDARSAVPWGNQIREELFFNDVLPYASVNETRDRWRADFKKRFLPLVKNAATPGEAAQILNRDIFPLLNVRYHATQRPKPDQSPTESIEAQYASCSGLSILLIDACRAVCVPARFVGTPRWATKRGNHSWVEVWDGASWQFTGACEYNEDGLSKTWFQADASKAIKDDPRRAIYASSWKTTGTSFPLVWNRQIDYVAALNVTDRYTSSPNLSASDPNEILVAIQLWDKPGGRRLSREISVLEDGEVVSTGTTKGTDDDANHWLEFRLERERDYELVIHDSLAQNGSIKRLFHTSNDAHEKFDFHLHSADGASSPLKAWNEYLAMSPDARPDLTGADFTKTPLSREDVTVAVNAWREDHQARIRQSRAEEMERKVITLGEWSLKFDYSIYGDKPLSGRSLFISMHGGGGAPTRVNDRQWENQKKLYTPEEGVYVAPRAPTDTWNLWHQAHIDPLFDRLIENMMVFEGVDPNRVYIMGYSAGGDGVYQLAPRMADRWAAAAMMAGHPNETSPLGLRNLAFTLHMGGNDSAYQRNAVARDWQTQLADLRGTDPDGYQHEVVIHEGLGHWMEKRGAVAVTWMAKFTRDPYPKTIVWKQDDVTHGRFYWISLPENQRIERSLLRAEIQGQKVDVESAEIDSFRLLLSDDLIDLDRSVTITFNGTIRFQGIVPRTLEALRQSFHERPDPRTVFPARVTIHPES